MNHKAEALRFGFFLGPIKDKRNFPPLWERYSSFYTFLSIFFILHQLKYKWSY